MVVPQAPEGLPGVVQEVLEVEAQVLLEVVAEHLEVQQEVPVGVAQQEVLV